MKPVEIPKKAFILAAGFGSRMMPLTENCPKPMLEIAGRSIIWRILDKLRAVGVDEVVVNAHYLGKMIANHMKEYMKVHPGIKIHVLYERKILDTGGGVKNGLKYFGNDPFYVIAGDSLWEDGAVPALERLAYGWDSNKMAVLTLLKPLSEMHLTTGVGDYHLIDDGRVWRSKEKKGDYMWTNIRINTPRIYQTVQESVFSFLDIMDYYEGQDKVYALKHDSEWHHISTPDDYRRVNARYEERAQKAKQMAQKIGLQSE